MQEVIETSNQYMPLAIAGSRIYFAMEALSSIHFLYQFSLQFFMDTLFQILDDEDLKQISKEDYTKRLELIHENIFNHMFNSVSVGLLE